MAERRQLRCQNQNMNPRNPTYVRHNPNENGSIRNNGRCDTWCDSRSSVWICYSSIYGNTGSLVYSCISNKFVNEEGEKQNMSVH